MTTRKVGVAAIAAMGLLLVGSIAWAQNSPREESAEEFNRRAQAQQDAYMRQWEADQAALQAQQGAPAPPSPGPSTESPTEDTPISGPMSTDERAALGCINDNRAAVQMPPQSLEEFRANRQAGMTSDAATLCGELHIVPEQSGPTNTAIEQHANVDAPPDNDLANTLVIALLLGCALAYFLPTFIAFRRGHEYRWIIAVLNVAAGWTGVAWAWVFIWSIWPRNRALASPIVDDATGIDSRRT